MKTALAIVCSLLLAWTNIVLAAAPGASVTCAARPCCHCGKTSGCCAVKDHCLPESLPVSAAPVSSFQSQFSPLAPATVAWALPDAAARELSSPAFPPLMTASTPLFERNCAWLI
ncbi:MAG TPA: hypothetical protein VH597_10670 [Verrucomicrobiae bacterium]|jgi:hypothetical protein|nr:hypothetical protein [Verrucomicrobiae bacterium]